MPDSFKAQLIILKRPMQLDICLSGGGEPYCVGSVERSKCENGCVGSTGRTGVGRVSSYSDIILVGVQEALDDNGGWLGYCSNKKLIACAVHGGTNHKLIACAGLGGKH